MTTLKQRAAPLLASAPYDKQRDTESFSNDVYRHLSAMTSMDLRSKGDIAQELAVRDALLREALGEIERQHEALEHIVRVCKGASENTYRVLWIHDRAMSALNDNDDWKATQKPRGYHERLEEGWPTFGDSQDGGE